MNKKTLFSLVGAASIAVSLSATAPVLAAETTNPNPTSTTTNTPSTGQTGTTDTTKPTDNAGTSKEPTPSKPINTADLNKAMSLNAKYAKLTRNSYVYDAKGKRVKNAKLKKGTIIFVSGLTTPDGQVLIGYNNKKGRYIKVNNVVLFKAVQYKVKKNAYVYNLSLIHI